MLLNRVAATGQGLTTLVVLTTAQTPIQLGFIRGPITTALGAAYVAACVTAVVSPADARAEIGVAALGVVWWVLRAVTLLSHQTWTGGAVHALVALLVFLFYWRSLARVGFLDRLTEIENQYRA